MSKFPTRIGIAITGTGFMAPTHTEALRRLHLPIVGILGSTPEKSKKAAEALGIPRGYADFEELLADPKVTSVHITTPNRHHHATAKAALLAGKHVLCEKPLAMNSRESADLVATARQTGLAAGVNYNIRYYPLVQEAAERVRSGGAGRVHAVTGRYVQDWLLYETDYNWRVLAEEGGVSRAVSDIGTHWLDLVLEVTGLEVEAVFADLQTVHTMRKRPAGEIETFKGKVEPREAGTDVPISTEDQGCVLLRFRGGARGCCWVSQMTPGRKNSLSFEVAAARQSLAWDSESPNRLWIGSRDEPNQILMKDPGLAGDRARPYMSYPGGHNEGYPDSFKQCLRTFYDFIRSGGAGDPLYPTFDDGHREIVLCDAIVESAGKARWVELPRA
ncbi:MAG: gfo/Idh/MocA family oxidoreductase [Puniceicoccaceae bacterium]|nr:MAG: gfo/Idh/MocA family oxidoreductase [Puniceicoccaceae bacterium]